MTQRCSSPYPIHPHATCDTYRTKSIAHHAKFGPYRKKNILFLKTTGSTVLADFLKCFWNKNKFSPAYYYL